jgi:hypothetical protein
MTDEILFVGVEQLVPLEIDFTTNGFFTSFAGILLLF